MKKYYPVALATLFVSLFMVRAACAQSISYTPLHPASGSQVIFTLSSRATDCVLWDFGDGSARVNVNNSSKAEHVYTREGNFIVKAWDTLCDDGSAPTAIISINIGSIVISSVRIRFEHGKIYKIVKKGEKLIPYADIKYDGSGICQYEWVVDGKSIGLQSKMLPFANHTTLKANQPLPTQVPGSYDVFLHILKPEPSFDIPVIRYHVVMPGSISIIRQNINISFDAANDAKGKTVPITDDIIQVQPDNYLILSGKVENNTTEKITGRLDVFLDNRQIDSQIIKNLVGQGEKTFTISFPSPQKAQSKLGIFLTGKNNKTLTGSGLIIQLKKSGSSQNLSNDPMPANVLSFFQIRPRTCFNFIDTPVLSYSLTNYIFARLYLEVKFESDWDKLWNDLREGIGNTRMFYSYKKIPIKTFNAAHDSGVKKLIHPAYASSFAKLGKRLNGESIEALYTLYIVELQYKGLYDRKRRTSWQQYVYYYGSGNYRPTAVIDKWDIATSKIFFRSGNNISIYLTKTDLQKGLKIPFDVVIENPAIHTGKTPGHDYLTYDLGPFKTGFKNLPKGWECTPARVPGITGDYSNPRTYKVSLMLSIPPKVLAKQNYRSERLTLSADLDNKYPPGIKPYYNKKKYEKNRTREINITFNKQSKPFIALFNPKQTPVIFPDKCILKIKVGNVDRLKLIDTNTNQTFTLYPDKNTNYDNEYIVAPKKTTTYKLIAKNKNGSNEMSTTLEIIGKKPVIDYFIASPDNLAHGEKLSLKWSYHDGDTGDGDVKIVNKFTGKTLIRLKGGTDQSSFSIKATHADTYTLIVTNPYGTARKNADFSVSALKGFWAAKPLINIFKADSYTIPRGNKVTLYYEYSGCEKALLYNQITNKETKLPVPVFGKVQKGRIRVKPANATTIYRLALVNGLGLSYKDIIIIVTSGLP